VQDARLCFCGLWHTWKDTWQTALQHPRFSRFGVQVCRCDVDVHAEEI